MHGAEETARIQAASAALFGGGDLHGLGAATLAAALREAGAVRAAHGTGIVDLLVAAGLAKSKGEARRTVAEGGAYLNNARVEDVDYVPTDGRPHRRHLAGAAARQAAPRRRRGR